MELEVLKQRWNELDNRLSKVETLNQKAVKEAVKVRTSSTIDKLKIKAWAGPVIGMFALAIVLNAVTNNEEMGAILNPNSVTALWIFSLVVLVYGFIEAALTSHIQITDPTTKIMKHVTTYKKVKTYSRLASLPIVTGFGALFIFFERGWIIERGRILPVVIFFAVYCLITVYAFIIQKRQDERLLNELDKELKELNELS